VNDRLAGEDQAVGPPSAGEPAAGALVTGERGARRLHDAAARHGAFAWTERRLFALTGAWAAAPGLADDARCALFEWSGQHAWHAQLWADRLPVLADVDRDAFVRPPSEALATALDMLAPPQRSERGHGEPGASPAGFLAALAQVVLPGLLAAYRAHGDGLVPVADRPAARALMLVLRDEGDELATIELLARATDIAVAPRSPSPSTLVARVEGLVGPGGGGGTCFSYSGG